MAQQTRVFSTLTDDSAAGTLTWANPGNAAADDGSTATLTLIGGVSHYLKAVNSSYATGSNTLSPGATINFIDYNVKRLKSGNPSANVRDLHLYSVEGGSVNSAHDYADVADWGTSYLTVAHTQNTNLPSASTILASDWGFVLQIQNPNGTGGGVGEVDWLYVTVDFTAGAAPNPVGTFIRQAVNRASNFCFFRAWKPLPRLIYRPAFRPVHFLPLSWSLAV